ncbi:MAG: hypothetical protein M5U09_09210 [Gammaproteobacteria bacterium]|nr:hypothetical protein [Gammaproteobacteria bacterium]
MVAGEGGAFEGVLVNVERPTEYYAAGEGVESARHTITVEPPPTVSRIDLYYEFPARSRRPPELVENGGDIVAVEGTTVEVRVTPSRPVDTALVRLNDDTQMTMTRDGDVLSARIAVADDGHYHVELPVTGGGMVRASRDYRIDALADTLPAVRILAPSGDIDVTSIEEVAFELAASDDLAVRELELVLWVNGPEEEIVDLATPEGVAEVRTGHELFLEERELAPGDLIAYHVRARDTPGDAAREVTSDIYFMQVRPFDRRFSRAPGGGGGAGGGGGGGEDGGMLSAQQRQLVIALFNLRQMADAAAEDVVDDRIATLSEARARIRDRVDAIVRRLESRQIPGIQATLDPMLDELPKASKAMREVEAELAEAELDPALESAREALVHLQRADAGFREMQVAMSNRGSGGSSNDLTNLFRLEMDRFRSNYEHVERGQWDSGRRELDEALRKLAELARRQQLELERRERQAAMGGGRGGASRDLVERAEELLRQLERLTRERPDPALERAAEAARDAARAMGEGGDADSQRQALRDLREAERALRERESGGIARGIDDALNRSRELVDRRGEVERGIEQLRGGNGEALDQVLDDKAQVSRGAGELDAALERLAGNGDADDDTREALRRSRRALRARALEELAEQSGQRLAEGDAESTAPIESAIRRALEGARDAIGEAREIAGGSGAGDESAEALRELVRSRTACSRACARARAREPASRVINQKTAARASRVSRLKGAPRVGRASNRWRRPGRAGRAVRGSRQRRCLGFGRRRVRQSAGRWRRPGRTRRRGRCHGRRRIGMGCYRTGRPRTGGYGGPWGDWRNPGDLRGRFLDDARRLEELRDAMPFGPRERGDIDDLVDALRELGESEVPVREIVRDHAAIVAALKDLEHATRAGDQQRDGLTARDTPAASEEYRPLIEEYFRRLSE